MSIDEKDGAVPIGFEDRLAIATPEGVEIELTLAGLGSRFIAAVPDFALQVVPMTIAWIVLDPTENATGAALFVLIEFAVQLFYHVLFEVLGGGRSPGKRWTGLRVVRTGGRPVTFVRSMLRNVLRIIDLLPGFYLVGMLAIFITNHNQRLGDLVAGTLVVRDRHGDRRHGEAPVQLPTYDPGPAINWDVSAVSADDIATVRQFLARRYSIDARARAQIARDLAGRLRPLVGGAGGDDKDERFLERLVGAKLRRG
jgi:uncharacterized RDD family membrane protein YckC